MGTDCTKTTLCLCDECVEIEVETEPFGVNKFRHGKPSSSSWGVNNRDRLRLSISLSLWQGLNEFMGGSQKMDFNRFSSQHWVEGFRTFKVENGKGEWCEKENGYGEEVHTWVLCVPLPMRWIETKWRLNGPNYKWTEVGTIARGDFSITFDVSLKFSHDSTMFSTTWLVWPIKWANTTNSRGLWQYEVHLPINATFLRPTFLPRCKEREREREREQG